MLHGACSILLVSFTCLLETWQLKKGRRRREEGASEREKERVLSWSRSCIFVLSPVLGGGGEITVCLAYSFIAYPRKKRCLDTWKHQQVHTLYHIQYNYTPANARYLHAVTRRGSKFNTCTAVNQSRQLVIVGFLFALCCFLRARKPAAILDEVMEKEMEDEKSLNKRA